MIWFDRSERSVVVGCRECHSREVCSTQGAADTWATDHLTRHPASEDKSRAIASMTRRHARHAS